MYTLKDFLFIFCHRILHTFSVFNFKMCFSVFKSYKTKKPIFKNEMCTKASGIKFNIYIFSWLKFNGKKFNHKIQCQRCQGQLRDTKRKAIDSAASQTKKRLYAPNYSGVCWMARYSSQATILATAAACTAEVTVVLFRTSCF